MEPPDATEVRLDVPGVTDRDIEVTIDDGTLIVDGARDEEREIRRAGYYRVERVRRAFQRRFSLDQRIDPERCTATLADGVLTLRLRRATSGEGTPSPARIVVRRA